MMCFANLSKRGKGIGEHSLRAYAPTVGTGVLCRKTELVSFILMKSNYDLQLSSFLDPESS